MMQSKRSFLVVVLSLLFTYGWAQRSSSFPVWTIGNAKVLCPARTELSTTFASKKGITHKTQLNIQTETFLVAPNAAIKINWLKKIKDSQRKIFFKRWKFLITTYHNFSYPTPILNLNGKYHMFQMPAEHYPALPTLNNQIILSIPITSKYSCSVADKNLQSTPLITFKAGVQKTLGNTPDLAKPESPFFMGSAGSFYVPSMKFYAIGFDTKFLNNLNYSVALKYYDIDKNNKILENTFFFYFGFGRPKYTRITAGYVLDVYSQGKGTSIYPVLDITFLINNFLKTQTETDKYLEYFR